MRLVTANPGELCVDTDTALSATECAFFVKSGIKGVWRYLSDLAPVEVATILGAGLKLFFVNHSRLPGWIPSATGGNADAKRDLADLQRLAIPVGVHVAFDLEEVGGGNPGSVITHVDEHAAGIQASKNLAALYVGAGALLNSVQLYALRSTLYWHSCSRVTDAVGLEAGPACGWGVYQGGPPDDVIGGVVIDWDYPIRDFKGRLPIGVGL